MSPAPQRTLAPRSSDPLAVRLRAFERYFTAALPSERETPPTLHRAMRYGALSPGKRLRPLLALTACEAVGGRWRDALPAAVAVECVHAFSLIHDDLPALDDDDYRRGRLTTHKKYGEAVGLLAGDALLAFAFEELTALRECGVSPARVVEAVGTLAYAAGSEELVGGQVLDLEAEGRRLSAADVEEIHVRKTGALISAAMRLGGLVGGASAEQTKRLGIAGRHLGLAFQIRDDLLNLRSSLERLGKRAGTDEQHGKATYPRAVGERAAREQAEHLVGLAAGHVRMLGRRAALLERLIQAVARRDR